MVTNFIYKFSLLQKHMMVAVIANTTACVVHCQDPLITAKEEVSDVTKLVTTDRAGFENEDATQTSADDPPQKHWREKIKIPEQFCSHCEECINIMTEFHKMWDDH